MNRPSVDECIQGFEQILDKINPQQMLMLQAHYHSGGRAATMRELATAAGYADYKMANLQYGNLARRLYKAIGYARPTSPRSGKGYWILGLGEFVGRRDFGLEMHCVMRPEVAEALERLGIVGPSRRSDEEMPDELRDVTELKGETEVYSQVPEPANDQKTTSLKIQPMPQAGATKDPPMGSYGSLSHAKRILVITGKSGMAEAAHSTIIRALDAGRSLDGGRIEDLSLLTQTIDGSYDLVELHGTINEALCLSCGHSCPPEITEETMWQCLKCDTFYESVIRCSRMLDDDDLKVSLEKAITCEFCIVAGSADVSDPAIRIAEAAKQAGAYLLECNEEKTALSEIADEVLLLDVNHLFHFFRCLRRPQDVRDHDNGASADLTPDSNIQEIKTSETDPIRVDFLRSEEFPFLNRLGMTFAPGKKQSDALSGVWNRDLRTDLDRLFNEFGTGTLISLVEDDELEELKITNLAEECDRVMINLIRFPIRDVSVPESIDDFVLMIAGVVDALKRGETIVMHCKGGLGRAGTTAACIAVAATDAEIPASDAIELVRRARPGTIETEAQEQFVTEFEDIWCEIAASRGDEYMLYWQERSVQEHASNDLPLDVIASNQLMNVVPGDTIWIVTLTQERELVLAGRLAVGEVVEYKEAIRRMPDAGLWQAEYYAFPEAGTEEYLRQNNIHHMAEDIRFDGDDDRLRLIDGKINPQQLQSIRKLTRQGADMLEEAFYTMGPFEADEFEPDVMLDLARQVVEMMPDDSDAYYNLGVALGHNEMYDDEIRAYERTLHLDPSHFGAQYNLGNVLIRLGRYEEAVEALNKTILISGEFAPGYFMLGVAYFESGRFNDALAATRQGLEIDPDDERAYYNIAYWTFLQGDYRGALARCDDVIARFPFYTSPNVLKGMCFRELGELDNEIRSYKDAVDIKVDDEGAFIINFTAVFFLGAAWERKITGSDEGIEYIEADNHFDLQDPTHQFCWAMGHLAQSDREYADQWIEGLRSSAPDLARRLEAAFRYVESAPSENRPIEANQVGTQRLDKGTQPADLASDDRLVELEGTKSVRKGQPRKQIQINVGGTEITAKHNPDLYFQVLKMLVERGALDNLDLPIASGRKRNFLSSTPFHKDGSNFLAPVEFCGYFMESHSSREQGIRMLQAFLERLGIESSVVAEEGNASVSVVEFQIPNFRERVLGSLLGLAVCDALGTTAEFKPTGSFPEIKAMIGGGPFGLNPGEWTDDTSMALCLADSLVEAGGFNASDQMDRYLRWKNEGYLSSNGVAFDIGTTIRAALEKYQRQTGDRDPYCGSISPASAGNGSLMRLAPVPLYFASDPREAILLSAESSRTTHGARECIDACRYFAGLIIGALQGKTKEEILSASFSPIPGLWEMEPLGERIAEVANGAFKSKKPPEISGIGQGYVVVSLHAALWAYYHTQSFRDGALKVVNLGYDSDTYGAIFGQLAGAYYGSAAVPAEWLTNLARRDIIEDLANGLIRRN